VGASGWGEVGPAEGWFGCEPGGRAENSVKWRCFRLRTGGRAENLVKWRWFRLRTGGRAENSVKWRWFRLRTGKEPAARGQLVDPAAD
ncbi:hypothetical protein, partial [Lachnoclostridium sp. An14]|uniref:hypothetical protein n=1 Tax=Lachnoclostridium sp. An14 TaxID=1965562 RepID=UPI001952125B